MNNNLIGRIYDDFDGSWEVTGVIRNMAQITCVSDGLNKGDESEVTLDEVRYFMGSQYPESNIRWTDEAEEIVSNGLYDVAVELMDDEIREELHDQIAPCSDLCFMEAYIGRHYEKFGEVFTVN